MENCPPVVCEASDLLLAFVNSGSLDEWLGDSGATPAGAASDVAAASELRASLIVLLREHSGCSLDPTEVEAAESHLRQVAARYPLVAVIGADTSSLVPAHDGAFGRFAQVLGAATDLAYRGAWTRVKVCKNDNCHRGFFDKTRNTSALYCSPTCSSQASMRAYRNRRKVA
ncbi:CGNR zinc finger domain-containing protein [Micromonospora musae]|uniref:CGNR zinc finger domain-containing protein n=1 Tax=Micromonospora musae TaxID=1894970 RepID=A0A3A9Y404_9ACTN|nr:CGNR zinc finger domain-containing protein [Micromonospora musae]RKN32191.1 CGNR zinc finger domain-containing protein [Micromonospora musae]